MNSAAKASGPAKQSNTAYYIFIGILIILLIVGLIFLFMYRGRYYDCRDSQSAYCYNIKCPGGVNPEDPCLGYAQRTNSDGAVECSTSVPMYKKPIPT